MRPMKMDWRRGCQSPMDADWKLKTLTEISDSNSTEEVLGF